MEQFRPQVRGVGSHREPGGDSGTWVVGREDGDHSELGRGERTGVDFIVPSFARGGGALWNERGIRRARDRLCLGGQHATFIGNFQQVPHFFGVPHRIQI